MIAAVLSAAGYRTGLFTSPHLDRVEERIVIDGQPCSAEELADLVELVRPAGGGSHWIAQAAGRDSPPEHGPDLLRDHHGRWRLCHFAAAPGRCRRVGGGAGRPARFDQRLHAARLDHHQHQLRPHPAVGRHAGRHRRGEGRHHQAGRAGHQRRDGRRAARGDSPHRPAKRLPAGGVGRRFRLRLSSAAPLGASGVAGDISIFV